MTYKVKTYIPSKEDFIYLEEFKNKNLIEVNKYIASNDDEGLSRYFYDFISCKTLNNLDYFCILLQIRGLCLGSKLNLSTKTNPPIKIELDINSILSKLINGKDKILLEKFFIDDLLIDFKTPTKIYYQTFNDLLLDIIQSITLEDKNIDIVNIKKLKKEYFIKLKNYILNYNSLKLSSIEAINLHVNFYNNSPLNLLKLAFTSNISSIYSKLYNCSSQIGITYRDFLEMSPSESDLLINVHKSANKIK